MIKNESNIIPCPCGSGRGYTQCCQPVIQGRQPATTAEALMRSRFSAFHQGEADYLISSLHPDFRQGLSADAMIDPATRWLKLEILDTEQGNTADTTGKVHFVATFQETDSAKGQFGTLEENSNFEQIDGRWYYRDGKVSVKTFKAERNVPCPCGSGKKFKRCCGSR